jgi:DNA invertase Pin-like site-specific DNA recombinase
VGETCWLYVVVSSEAQSATLEGTEADLRRLAAEKGWKVTQTFSDTASGKKGVRALFRELTTALREVTVLPTWVLTSRADRIGRGSIGEALVAQQDILKLGVRIFTRAEGEIKLDSAIAELMGAVRAAAARTENENRSDKLEAAYRKRRLAAQTDENPNPIVGNRMPYGLAFSANGGIAQEPQATTVREIFRLRIEGLGHSRIAQAIAPTAAPAVYKNGKYGNESTVHWTTQRVARVLANRRYVPSVIDEETFVQASKVNAHLGVQTIRPQRKWPFKLATALTCWCGRKMNGICTGPTRKRILYYICKAAWNHEGKVRMVRATSIEDQFEEILDVLGISTDSLEKFLGYGKVVPLAQLTKSLHIANRQRAAVKKKRGMVIDLYLNGSIAEIDVQPRLDQFDAELGKRDAGIAQIKEQIALQTASEISKKDRIPLPDIAVMFREGTIDDQRRIARLFATDYGLVVTRENKLKLGFKHDPGRQRKPQARELPGAILTKKQTLG